MSVNSNSFKIKFEQLLGIGDLLKGKKSKLSPFNTKQSYQLSASDIKDLETLNILADGGNISSEFLPVFENLAKTKAYTRLRYSGGTQIFEYMSYFTDTENENISVITTNDGLLIKTPSSHEDILDGLSQLIGESAVRSSDFKAELSKREALVLIGLFDLVRKEELLGVIDSSKSLHYEYEQDEVVNAINNYNKSTQNSVYLLRRVTGFSEEVSIGEIESSIDNLISLKLLSRKGNKIALLDDSLTLAGRLLVIDNVISLSSGSEMPNGEVVFGGFTCVQAGVNDILYLEDSGDKVELQAITSALILSLINEFLNKPFTADELQISKSSPISDKTQEVYVNICTKCRNSLPKDAKFCQACGEKAGAETETLMKQFCPTCGLEIKEGAKFCSGCGAKI